MNVYVTAPTKPKPVAFDHVDANIGQPDCPENDHPDSPKIYLEINTIVYLKAVNQVHIVQLLDNLIDSDSQKVQAEMYKQDDTHLLFDVLCHISKSYIGGIVQNSFCLFDEFEHMFTVNDDTLADLMTSVKDSGDTETTNEMQESINDEFKQVTYTRSRWSRPSK